jgi:hypothetical protein
MKKFEVVFEEKIYKSFIVEAYNDEKAYEIAEQLYTDGKVASREEFGQWDYCHANEIKEG